MLYQLSYVGAHAARREAGAGRRTDIHRLIHRIFRPSPHHCATPTDHHPNRVPSAVSMERETGFEPATNSLEGCDSTPELLPRSAMPIPRYCFMVGSEGFEPP